MLDALRDGVGGYRRLSDCNGNMNWPDKGVYFFFENGELRNQSGNGPRVVRVGTHAVSEGSRTTLWNRLSNHRGTAKSGGGNHRGSVFRLLIGASLSNKHPHLQCALWGDKQSAPKEVRVSEHGLECAVSKHIGSMPFLWLEVDDASAPDSMRSYIERNSIALLSNFGKANNETIDPASKGWLGKFCPKENIPKSGLWNSNHVAETYDPEFLLVFRKYVDKMTR
ncbi:MAG: hypothetical protein HZC51_13420 [Nitrospirae bacterium]|nr:hypothetical protein [Nitrospirota bacterium]